MRSDGCSKKLQHILAIGDATSSRDETFSEEAKKKLEKAEKTPPPQEQMEKLKGEILKVAVERIRVVKEYKVYICLHKCLRC